ncbi:unnamed protein product [Brachionus calyciflorus]|uniref:Disks large-associated protein 5 n=1 Tax=Brachionus calyciflorus TaxID=104777 RepID=A0A813P8R8_9BILA|nr:unnamed protein product [Brachionus calyciflorus]
MEDRRDRKGLFKMMKNVRNNETNSSNLYSPSASKQPSRSDLTSKIHNQRLAERKLTRDKVLDKGRPIGSNSTAQSAAPSRGTTPSTTRPPVTSTLRSRQPSASRPPSVTRPPPVTTSKPTNPNDSVNTTYTVDQTQVGANLSKTGTIATNARKKLLEEYRQKKLEQEKLKVKKPVFKAGSAEVKPQVKSSVQLPTSSSFNFSLSLPGTKPPSATIKKSVPPSASRPPVTVSKAPVRSQSVRQVISKETPKITSHNLSQKTKFTPSVQTIQRKNTAPEKKITKPVDFNKELDLITNKMNTSVSLKPKTLEIRVEITQAVEDHDEILTRHNETRTTEQTGLNETRLDTVQPNLTSSPIRHPECKQIQVEKDDKYFEDYILEKRDVKYYRDLVTFNTKKLNKFGDLWNDVYSHVPEDIQGDIRSACGLAKLLIDERFAQFSDLIQQCEETSNSDVGLTVKCSDLQGFWDMVDVQVKDVCKKFDLLEKIKLNNYVKTEEMFEKEPQSAPVVKNFKPNRNYLKKKDQKPDDNNEEKKVEAKVEKPKVDRLAELKAMKAKMKAMKAQSFEKGDDIEIQIAQPAKPQTPMSELCNQEIHSSGKRTRRSVRKSVVINDQPVEKKYNLRSRPSDLIKFDSPLATKNGLENLEEEPSVLSNTLNMQSPVKYVKKSNKKSIYPVIKENEMDKENDDFFNLDDCPQLTWKTRPSIYPTAPQTPSRFPITPGRPSIARESISHSPLLKLALISGQSKRLSVNSLNRIFDKLE